MDAAIPSPDTDGITRVATRDEAIAVALHDARDGDEVFVHDASCACDADGKGCNCDPELIVVRRGKA